MTLHWFRFCLIFLCLPGISGLFAEDGESPVHFESVPGMLSCRTPDSCSSGTFRVENRGSRKAEVWMSLRVESWNRETLSVERSFLLPPHTVRKVTLFYPLPRSYGNQKLSIAVDGKRVESPSLIFPSAVWGKIALTSPALPLEDYRKLGLLGGNPHPVVPTVSLAQWGTELRDYSACGMIFLSSRDRLSAGAENAIRNWMMLGGVLVRYVAPSDPWPEGVPEPENSCLVQSCGWGKEIICRPIPPEKELDAARAIRALEKREEGKGKRKRKPSFSPTEEKRVKEAFSPSHAFIKSLLAVKPVSPRELASNHYENLLMPEVENVPLPVLLWVMLAFVILIGPVNYFVLRRRNREPWILVTTPALSLAFCLLVILYITFHEGWHSRGKSFGVTFLDQERGVAATKAWNVLYAPIRPKDGLRFSAGDCLAFPRGMGECTLNLNEGQRYSPSLVQPRVPLIYAVSRAEPRKERLRVIRNADGTLSVVNGLSGNLSALALVDGDGRIHIAGASVMAGARAELKQAGRADKTGELRFTPAREFPKAAFSDPDGGVSALKTLARTLPRGHYAALSDTPLFYTPGVIPDAFTCRQLILGKYNSGEENHAD